MCPHRQVVTRFVEPDMAVGSDAEQLQVDTARRSNRCFVPIAFRVQVWSGAIQKVDSFRTEIDASEEVTFHECPEASWMLAVDAGEFVEVECGGPRPVGVPRRMDPAQLRVGVNRRTSRCQTKYRVRFGLQR